MKNTTTIANFSLSLLVLNTVFKSSNRNLIALRREIGDVAVQTTGYPANAFKVHFVYKGESFGGESVARFLVNETPDLEHPLLKDLLDEYFKLKDDTETLKENIKLYLTHYLNIPPEEKYDRHFELIFLSGLSISTALPQLGETLLPLFNEGINQELLEAQQKTYGKATEIINYIAAVDILDN